MPLDLYHIWLGIPPTEQPPNHYRLLGVSAFESNEQVIDAAAIRQTLHVRSLKLGEHSSIATRILQEIEVARICLLSPQMKSAYDEQLRDSKPVDTSRIENTANSETSPLVAFPASTNAASLPATSSDFDAYYQWLGIPSHEQPPDHYRLLGIPSFESNTDVINHAADRQMGYARTFEASEHASSAEEILNQIAAARLCLLNPSRKAQYDRQLGSANATADVVDESVKANSQQPPRRQKSLPVAVSLAPNESTIARQQEETTSETPENPTRIRSAAEPPPTTVASVLSIDDKVGAGRRNRLARSYSTKSRRLRFYFLSGVGGGTLVFLLVVAAMQNRNDTHSDSDETEVMNSTNIESDKPPEPIGEQATPSSITTNATASRDAENKSAHSLFNGVDLSGWTAYRGRFDTWQVEDGAIVTIGRHSASWLITDVDYADFRWSFEFLVEPRGDSGVTIRANPMDSLGARRNNLEINLHSSNASPQFRKSFPTGGLFWTQATRNPMSPDTLAELDPQGGWNEMVIEAHGPIIKVSVNGLVLASYDLEVVSRRPGAIPNLAQPKGRIGFQSWDKVARFRNIRIEKL